MAVQLKGPINDIHNMKNFLIKRFNWKETPETMLILTDDQNDPSKIPTRANMIAAMKWLVNGASNGDVLFFHYSGHGGQVEDKGIKKRNYIFFLLTFLKNIRRRRRKWV